MPRGVGQPPVVYNFKPFDHVKPYLDVDSLPAYPLSYGLSYTTFTLSNITAADAGEFSAGETIRFAVHTSNNGTVSGLYVAHVYLLGRVSSVVRGGKQLVAF